MSKSRRNFYRILHVQPEAPEEVIRASYRTLMQSLKMHPDLGGDHEQAALLNEAYAVLSDPENRARYDQKLAPLMRRARSQSASEKSSAVNESASVSPAQDTAAGAANQCPFCLEPVRQRVHSDTRCRRCHSPLASPRTDIDGAEVHGRRQAARAV